MDGKRIKQIIINGEVFDTSVDIFSPKVPVGAIVIWSGEAYNIPTGWHLCDGEDGTPDLRDKFVLGAGTNHSVGTQGGQETVTLTVAQMPSHAHSYSRPSSSYRVTTLSSGGSLVASSTTSSYNSGYQGSTQAHENMPPYYALCFIMKVKPDATDSGGGTSFVALTKEEYKNLSDYEKNADVLYITTDGGSSDEKGAKVYGVMWDSSNPSTVLTRLTKDNDSNGYVNTNITTNPVAAVGNEGGSSPFDALYPWVETEEYNITSSGKIYKSGQDGFSRTEYDTMVYIPEFWYKVVKNDDKWCWYISDKEKDGFEKHPGSGRYVGRYNTSRGYYSVSAEPPLVEKTREEFRTRSHAKAGDNWWQYDYATWCAVWLLYLVEFADWDSQKVIGQGIVNDTAAHNSGETDSMIYHTGRASGEDGKTAVQYRHIENPWGNVCEFVDGINFIDRFAYISVDNTNFQDDTMSNGYDNSGIELPNNNNFITNIGYSEKFPWSFLPASSEGGSDKTYISDYVQSRDGETALLVGGNWASKMYGGLFCFFANAYSSVEFTDTCSRLLYIPKGGN